MATTNPFDLLGDDDNDDPSFLIAAQQEKVAAAAKKAPAPAAFAASQPPKQAKLPTKPLPPAQAVRDSKNDGQRGGGRGVGRGYGRGRGGGVYSRDFVGSDNAAGGDNGFQVSYNKPSEDRESGRPSERRGGYGGPRGGSRGGYRGGFTNGEAGEGERPRRVFERRSGTGRGSDFKRDGAGRGNWGTSTDEILLETEEPAAESETNVTADKVKEENVEAKEENPSKEPEEKEPEEKQMTLEEYEKVLEEKRKALLALKAEERKVDVDKEFESMQLISKKKDADDVFIKLGSDKDKKREAAEKEERAKKALSINEFLKPAEGESYYRGGGRGRGRGGRGPPRGGFSGGNTMSSVPAPSIEDPGQFPTLGGK